MNLNMPKFSDGKTKRKSIINTNLTIYFLKDITIIHGLIFKMTKNQMMKNQLTQRKKMLYYPFNY